jgi:hypothetical protein
MPTLGEKVAVVKDKNAPVMPSKGASGAQVIPTDEYNRIVHSADLSDLRLMDCQFEVKPAYFRALADMRHGGAGPDFSFGFSHIEYKVRKRENQSIVGSAIASIEANAVRGEEKLLFLEAKYFISYTFIGDHEENAISLFLDRVAKFAIYPYFRQLASSMASAAHAELPLLPILKDERSQTAPGRMRARDGHAADDVSAATSETKRKRRGKRQEP